MEKNVNELYALLKKLKIAYIISLILFICLFGFRYFYLFPILINKYASVIKFLIIISLIVAIVTKIVINSIKDKIIFKGISEIASNTKKDS